MAMSSRMLTLLGFLLAVQSVYGYLSKMVGEPLYHSGPAMVDPVYYYAEPSDVGSPGKCEEALYVKAAVSSILEKKKRDNTIDKVLMKKAWDLSEKCIDEIAIDETQRKIFLEYYYLEHFVELQIVRAKKYFYNARKKGSSYADLFMSLVDPRFLGAFKNAAFPEGPFWLRKRAAIALIKEACSNVNGDGSKVERLPDQVKRNIRNRQIRHIFLALMRDEYVNNIGKDPYKLTYNWKRFGALMKRSSSGLQNTCFDMSVIDADIDPAIAKIRNIAVEIGFEQCIKTEVYPTLLPMKMSYVMAPFETSFSMAKAAPVHSKPSMSNAPVLGIDSGVAAPDNDSKFPIAPP